MKKLFFLLIAATGALSVNAQDNTKAPDMPMKKVYTHDSLLLRWVLDINMLGGGLMQTITTNGTTANYPNQINSLYNDGGKLKFTNGTSIGFDAQLGFFFGHKRHFGVGAGFMYLSQMGDVTATSPFHVEYQATDFQGNTYRQLVTSNQPIKESLTMTNMNIPIVLKYKTRFSKHWGFTADLGALINVQEKNAYSSNATFDYEAIYQYALNSDNKTVNHTNYDNSAVPAANDILYTKAAFTPSSAHPTLAGWFQTLQNAGYNVGLGVSPNKNSGNYSYTTGSVGLIARPAINYFLSDNVALTVGGYFLYQPFTNTTNNNYQATNKVGDYSSILNGVGTNNSMSYGGNVGVRIFFGKPKDTDHDGVPDKSDWCPTVPGLVQFHGCPDSDGDGIPDNEDSCVNVAGIAKFHGCPDSDGDGIPDKDDACPYQAGLPQFQGCPDRDGDGIPDKDDLCPDKPGPAKYHGCPDTDGDGVPDNEDLCPTQPGPESNHGCPLPPPPPPVVETVKLSTPIMFEVNKTSIHPSSHVVLEEAVRRLNADPDAYVEVDGYADASGKPAYNQKLSLKRAKAVKEELIQMGVKPSKIKILGHGSKNPAESNSTPEGRQRNRRAVMHLNMVG